MTISRRKFLQVGTFAAAAGTPLSMTLASVGTKEGWSKALLNASANPNTRPANPGTRMSKAQFSAYLNTTFFLRSSMTSELPMQLVELEDMVPEQLKDAAARRGLECFSLAFRGPSKSIKQDTYHMRHAALGEFDLFIGNGASKKHGRIYEAIVNHLKL